MGKEICPVCSCKKISLLKGGSKRCQNCGFYLVDNRQEWEKK